VSYEDARDFADGQNLNFMETSAKDAKNVEESFLRLAKNIKEKFED
jgi:Ras-related protein Rab-1A